ncbi:hypothetical protein CTI12_AA558750 [Artemisia annua]|uniref:Nucleic acid-binding, OB-fold protein n=1 Tax=Artemisia annua TaxID=35608 RepID=A0A2U1KPM5_ARTAN|nr:hypothetical protein CTI12_AA558750 [Artemisia annua]
MTVSDYVHCASETVFEASQQPSEVHVSDLLASNFERSIDATPMDSIAASSMPVQVMTVDGLVSTFEVTNVAPSVLGAGRCSPYFQGSVLCVGASTSNDDRHVDEQSTVTPMLLDFSYPGTPRLSTTRRSMHSGATRMSARQQRTRAGTRRRVDMDTSPVQGPIAPPQRQGCYIFLFFEFHFIRVFIAVLLSLSDLFRSYFSPGAPADYKSFGRCDQICQHCHAIFWLAEKRSGLPVSAAPQYQRCCAGGRAYLPRDKLREADIPNFQIRLFGVVGANQYELPTADTIGAIVYEGGPESMTDYDVVIERHSMEPESVNKLHPAYMSLQFPLLFVYGEEDYIGYIHNVEKVKEYGSATGNKVKVRNIALRNLNNNVVMFTLWNEKADAFEEDEYAQMRKPVILAVSSCYLKRYGSQIQLSATSATCYYFNPPIEEASELLAAYNQTSTQHPQLEVQTQRLSDWEQERTRDRVPLGTLLQIDQNTQQRVLFTQDAMILQVDTTYDWYYQKCSECGGKLDYGFVHGHCYPYGTESKSDNSYSFRMVITDGTGNATMTCFSLQTDGLIKDINTLLEEVAEKNPSIIPPQILALQNTRHVFQFRFAKPAGKGPPTFVLQKVMDHPPSILPASAEGPSSPSTVPVYTLTDSQATPPPATPVTAENTPADTSPTTTIPVTSIVRKELFKGNTDEDSDPQHNNQKTQTASEVIPLSATSSATQGTPTNIPLTVSLPITSVIRKEASKNTTDKEGDPESKKQKVE